MEFILLLISLFALGAYAVFSTAVLKINGATAPLTAISFTIIYFTVFGMLGLLVFGGYLYFLLAAAIAVLFALKKIVFPKMTLWFYIFMAISAVMALFFAIRQPLLNSWDEFSFWGTAVKMTKVYSELYTTAEIGWDWVASQKPGLIVLSYFFQFFGGYEEWKIFVALNIMALSVIVAALAPFQGANKKFAAVPFFIFVLVPYVFTIYVQLQEPSNVYMNAHSDVPMAWLFCGVFIVYYALKNIDGNPRLLPTALVITALCLTRDTALPFALIAWGIIAIDILFFTKGENVEFWNVLGIRAKFAHIGVILSCVLLTFFVWAAYIGKITGANPLGNIGGTEEIGMVSMLVMGVTQLFGINTTQFFSDTMSAMVLAFFNFPMSMVGSSAVITVGILCVLTIAALSSKDKVHSKACVSFMLLSSLGFAAYHTFIGFTYAFIFKGETATQLIGYERYIYPYFIGWFVAAVFLLCISALNAKKWLMILPNGTLLLILCLFIYRFNSYVPQGMTFVDYHDGYLYQRQQTVKAAQDVVELIGEEPEGKIFFISQSDNGNMWFQFSSGVLPLQLDYSFGGGTLTLSGSESDDIYAYEMSFDELLDYLHENDCAYVLVEQSSYSLVQEFGVLFSDNLDSCDGDKSAVYKVVSYDDMQKPVFELMGGVG